MTDSGNTSEVQSIFKKYLPSMGLYGIILSGLHLYTFWSHFGINVFEYANPSNIFLLSCVGIAKGIVASFVIIVLGELIHLDSNENSIEHRIKRKLIPHLSTIIYYGKFLYAGVLIYYIFISTNPGRLSGILIMLCIPAYYFAKKSDFLLELKNDSIRSIFVALVVFAPLISARSGNYFAAQIITGSGYYYTESLESSEESSLKVEKKLRYIGTIGEYVFFFDPAHKTSVITTVRHLGVLRLYKKD